MSPTSLLSFCLTIKVVLAFHAMTGNSHSTGLFRRGISGAGHSCQDRRDDTSIHEVKHASGRSLSIVAVFTSQASTCYIDKSQVWSLIHPHREHARILRSCSSLHIVESDEQPVCGHLHKGPLPPSWQLIVNRIIPRSLSTSPSIIFRTKSSSRRITI